MKFSHKLAVAIVLPVCMALSIGGTWSIHQNFYHALDTATQTHVAEQMSRRYELEAALTKIDEDDSNAIYSQITYYAEQQRQSGEDKNLFAVMGENGTILYSNAPQEISYQRQRDAVAAEEQSAIYAVGGAQTYQLLATQMRGVSRPLWLINVYDVSRQFSERDRQIRQHLILEGVVLLLAGGAAIAVSHFMTEPLRQLETASRALSNGNLTVRAQINSGDEMERLGNTFNSMAQAVCEQMEALTEEADRQKRFVAAFTHELKTPMTAILGYGNLLRSGEQSPEKRHLAAEYIYHESLRLEALSRELLLLLGLEQGGVALEKVALAAVRGELLRSLPELEPRLLWQCEDVFVLANQALLVTLLRNLILNAAAADSDGAEIEIWSLREAEKIRLGVTDRGPGISQDEIKRITEPFYRVDKSRSRNGGGNGLGLTICEQIAQVHQTHLQIESHVGRGTTVSIELWEAER